ncbi:halocyanin domain-containing protein [Halogeometricum borinquense]|uniref:Halocyanin domain-containing protein n=2 Tax=Halogeometricum borinquense TaxID=60847 RepID=A0A6C0UN20_9EURY|nr:halocyanin domain-containing protein [Halogeometricum borinquense]
MDFQNLATVVSVVFQIRDEGIAMNRSPTRRQYLQSAALTSIVAVAGCSTSSNRNQSIGNAVSKPATTEASESTPAESLKEWLSNANGYDGNIRRYGPGSRPTIAVGKPVDGKLAFSPPAIEVAPMTIVTWDWTGHGEQHNVVALDGTFDSGRTNAQRGTSYHYIFEEPGEYRFVSEPHSDDGMKGAIIVKEPPSTGNETVDKWVVDSSNFDGNIADRTETNTATVTVGAEGNGGHFAFDPPVLKIAAGTTVEWKWSDEGNPHNVVFKNADIKSEKLVDKPGVHFENTFDEPGTYLYACKPHGPLGMKGAVIVE